MARALPVRNPRSGEADYTLVPASAATVRARVAELRRAQPGWRALGVGGRIDVLRRWQAALRHAAPAVQQALSLDTGRNRLAASEIGGLIGGIERWCALAPDLLQGVSQDAQALPDVEILLESEPYAVLGAISPWNFPLLLSFIDATPALLAGSAVAIKPSEVTPRFAEPLRESIAEVPELAAVLDIVPGDGETGAALIGEVDVVAFTGSVATGRKVAVAAAEAFIPAFLELGGKDPAIVLPGSDLERAATAVLRASVAATGQACQSLERLYVHDTQAAAFVDLLAAKAGALELTAADPSRGSIGPLIFERQAAIIREHLDDAREKGATVVCGGEVRQIDGGWWIAPTVLADVDHSMQVMTAETFGPIMPVMRYSDIDTAVELANDSIYGLSGAVFGPDEAEAVAVGRRMNAGGVSINDAGLTTMLFETEKSAFGFSGMGPSRVGASGLTRFLRRKSLYVNRGDVLGVEIFSEQGFDEQDD
ncbi:MAG: aldehyde dehydrogenase family protein [Pseudomonadota bacterium]